MFAASVDPVKEEGILLEGVVEEALPGWTSRSGSTTVTWCARTSAGRCAGTASASPGGSGAGGAVAV
jgi:hypothetical protein